MVAPTLKLSAQIGSARARRAADRASARRVVVRWAASSRVTTEDTPRSHIDAARIVVAASPRYTPNSTGGSERTATSDVSRIAIFEAASPVSVQRKGRTRPARPESAESLRSKRIRIDRRHRALGRYYDGRRTPSCAIGRAPRRFSERRCLSTLPKLALFEWTAKKLCRLGLRRSTSTKTTRRPPSANARARFATVVDFPSVPCMNRCSTVGRDGSCSRLASTRACGVGHLVCLCPARRHRWTGRVAANSGESKEEGLGSVPMRAAIIRRPLLAEQARDDLDFPK